MKVDLGRSPDKGDAVVMANIVTMKLEQYRPRRAASRHRAVVRIVLTRFN
jgi:hypothetical protein